MSARILVIEDNQTNLELISYLLTHFGYTVLSAQNGQHGIKLAQQELPDLILCDIHMAPMDGYEVVRFLQNHPRLNTIRRVAITALAMVGDRDKILTAGFHGYIAKPIAPETFVAQVEVFLPEALRNMHINKPNAQLTPAQEKTTATTNAFTLLIVDDSANDLELTSSIFTHAGYRILTASSTNEALLILQTKQPDLIVSDLHMPDRDGLDFLRILKKDARWKNIPFVFISSTTRNEAERILGLNLGAGRFILRPIEPRILLTEIETYLAEQVSK